MRMKKAAAALILGMVLLCAACGAASPETNDPQPGEAQTGEGIFSSFTTKDLDGNIVDQDILKGKKLTIINVWATFCGPCLREMPELEKLSKEMADRDVQVVGIVVDVTNANYQIKNDQMQQAKEIVSQTGVSFPSLIPCRDLETLCGVQAVPTTFFVDENGRQIGNAYVGARDLETWSAIVEHVLEEIP